VLDDGRGIGLYLPEVTVRSCLFSYGRIPLGGVTVPSFISRPDLQCCYPNPRVFRHQRDRVVQVAGLEQYWAIAGMRVTRPEVIAPQPG
jgi:hypothetical protein